ncbi:MAG: TIGR00296 family protein [Deltaproteobacteria bacterium]|nr:TIGR00296 family protein [Deltaproteobacteria bacterium]
MDSGDGKSAVKLARKAVDHWVNKSEKLETRDYPKSFEKRRGVFVTLHTYPDKDLRGCVGFVEPVHHLVHGIIEASVYACQDQRFPPVSKEELKKIIVEVSVMTEPEQLFVKPEDRLEMIKLGKDGLIIVRGAS